MSAINDALVAEIKRLEGVADEWQKTAHHNASEFKKLQEVCDSLQERLDKVISMNIELKQFKENCLERKRKRKKRKKSFPDVPP